jgi:hypothetical protein
LTAPGKRFEPGFAGKKKRPKPLLIKKQKPAQSATPALTLLIAVRRLVTALVSWPRQAFWRPIILETSNGHE